jgi:outer membrane lipoprotein-sorting protein
MEKKLSNSRKISSSEIKEQFNRLEGIAAEFSQKIFALKKEQENFKRYMESNKLMH